MQDILMIITLIVVGMIALFFTIRMTPYIALIATYIIEIALITIIIAIGFFFGMVGLGVLVLLGIIMTLYEYSKDKRERME